VSIWIALLLIGLAGLALLIGDGDLIMGLAPQEFAALAGGLGLLLLVVPGIGRAYSGRLGSAARDFVTWVAIGFLLLAGYSYRDQIGQIAYRIAGELAPPGSLVGVEQTPSGDQAVRIRRRTDSHFVANTTINGVTIPMLVDTGASTVVLKQADAKRLGLDTGSLRYTVPVQTANGLAYAAHVRLKSVAIGPISLSGIDALVAQPNVLKESLLGMSFLGRLRSYEFSGEFVTFRN
jgi:aspartyl protease family protein